MIVLQYEIREKEREKERKIYIIIYLLMDNFVVMDIVILFDFI